MTPEERIPALDDFILHGKEWDALKVVRDELVYLRGRIENLQNEESA